MNKTKIIFACLLILFFILIGLAFLKIKHHEDYRQKIVLAKETRKVLDHLMVDIYQAREASFKGIPADGLWHNRIAFENPQLGPLEYVIKDGHLLRINSGKTLLIADNMGAIRIRHQKETPDILEVQIEAQNNVSLISNLKIRVRE